jgi:dTDP-glucose 4,6-dehydratase
MQKECITKRIPNISMIKNKRTTVLITGGAGFIGANFINYFLVKYPEYKVINLDLLTHAANLKNLSVEEYKDRYEFIHGDVCDSKLVTKIFDDYDIKGVIHFAAESHVDNSIKDPEKFVRTNVHGTFVLLNVAKNKWLTAPFKYKSDYQDCRFHHVSTDEVYGTLGAEGYFTESTSYAPNSPYSASKAGSDMIARSYFHTYGLNLTISNCSNNYGQFQHDEKLIPTIIRNALAGQSIPIYGNGTNIRDWLYVEDHCKAIDLVYHKADAGETYLVGGNSEKTNLDLANLICEMLDNICGKTNGSYKDQLTFVEDRAGHDFRYAIDFSKVKRELGWTPEETFKSGLQKTVEWYIRQYK